MNIHVGIWNFDGTEIDGGLLARLRTFLKPDMAGEARLLHKNSLVILYDARGTDAQPVADLAQEDRPWIFWEGRLDNRRELESRAFAVPGSGTDTDLLRKIFEREGVDAFPQIIGDWAICCVCEARRDLVLARDFVGARSLFYRIQKNSVMWSNVLEALLVGSDHLPELSEEYLAGWLSFFPEAHRTPYRDILSVPPASFVRITPGNVTVHKYWNLESAKPVRYRTDRQYEEHFVSVFREAVRRRIADSGPILAELSGGMDSTSIVCMADSIVQTNAGYPRIDTVTYFDSEESNWDELPYALKVEEKRGRAGHHIEIGPAQGVTRDRALSYFRAVPISTYDRSSSADAFDRIVFEGNYRVLLSGLGGDEVLGGVPTPIPELADLLARFRGGRFVRQSFRWALAKKKPLLHLWRDSVMSFAPCFSRNVSSTKQDWSWLQSDFRERNQSYLGFQSTAFRFFGPLPSLQANAVALEILGRQVSCAIASTPRSHEWRYPFLDRDLVSFCSSIPREQMARPGQRRSLMRRALAGLVPPEILDRKRKAYVSRGAVKILAAEWSRLNEQGSWRGEENGLVISSALARAVEKAMQGEDTSTLPLLRIMALEQWLRRLRESFAQASFGAADQMVGKPIHAATEQLLGREKSQ
jgi:asparagine synthase (glutamine-hydrolysing)